MKKFYVITSIPYANAKPHMGHALDPLYADVIARYYRKKGLDVILQVGLDENGQKIYQKAMEKKLTVPQWLEHIRPDFLDFEKELDISYNLYTRTSEKEHFAASQEMWRRAQKNGDIYKKKYTGLYCIGCEEFKKEADLIDGKCPDHQTAPELVEEENYFFSLSKYADFLKKHFEENKDFVYPKNRYNEAYQMIKDGLEDVSISRPKTRLPWGVPVPDDDTHVMYVWFDALVNYLTGIGFPVDQEKFEKYWPADLEIVGKDNNRWHTLLWPAMLKSAGLALPKQVLVHSYIMGKGGVKMSKTIGNVVDPLAVIDKYGADPFRYYLLSRVSLENDGIFDLDLFKSVYETELGNELGNLVQRTLTMINKYDIEAGVKPASGCENYDKLMEGLSFSEVLKCIWGKIRKCNQTIEIEKPWELAKTNQERLGQVLSDIYEDLVKIADLLEPFLPDTSVKMQNQLKSKKPEPLFPRIDV